MDKRIAIIGCGNLGQSIASGLLDSGYPAENIIVTRRNINPLAHLQQRGIKAITNNTEAIQNADFILFGLKPYVIEKVLNDIRTHINTSQILVSLATGITIEQMERVVGNHTAIFRAMPNTGADVRESLTCICGNNIKQQEQVQSIFNTIGETVIINEQLMEAATVLGACGIAFVLRFIRGMIQGGIQIGFDAKTATQIVNQTVKGATELLQQRGNHPEYEIDKVTTPRGCTIEGLNEMEHNGFSSALIKGIVSSYKLIEK